MVDLFWLSDAPWAVIEPFMPRNQPGPERKADRQIIPGILHVLTSGCRWRDRPAAYGPRTTVYDRWSRRGFWRVMLADLAKAGWSGEEAAIDATYVKAHRSAQGGKGGTGRRALARRAAAKAPRSTPSSTSSAADASGPRPPSRFRVRRETKRLPTRRPGRRSG